MLCQGCQILAHSDMPDDMPDNLVLARDLSMSGHSSGGAKIDLHEKTPALAKDAGVMNQRRPGAIREDFSRLRALATQ